jgi:hypothetical protein
MTPLGGGEDSTPLRLGRSVVLVVGFVLCLVGAGGLAMDDMAYQEVSDGSAQGSAMVRAAAGADREVPLPAAASGAMLALGLGVTLAAARRP